MRTRTRWTGVTYLLLTAAGLTGGLWLALAYRSQEAVVPALVGLGGMYMAWAQFQAGRVDAARDRQPDALVTAAADALAQAVWQQWDEEARKRRLYVPEAIPVRWSWSRHPVTGHESVALGNPEAPAPFNALPGVPAAESATVREGGLGDLFLVYGGLRSGRIVVLGAPGSGKSDAAVRTVLDALRHRRELDDERRARVPVPVLLTVTRWDHERRSLFGWLADRLAADYRFLRSADHGRDAAERLVATGRIALFLDGFDELAPALRRIALEEIDRHAPCRVMLFCRTEDYLDTVRAGHLHGAAALELSAVSRADAAAYLERLRPASPSRPWDRLIEHLNDEPDSVLSRSLDSPLTLTLVRDGVRDSATVDDLLTPGRCTTRDDVVAYLLDRFVDVAYRPRPGPAGSPYAPEDARRWLGYLAAEMARRDLGGLDWRRLHWWASPFPRVAVIAAVGMFVSAGVGAVVFGPGRYKAMHHTGAEFGAVYMAGLGLLFGFLVGAVSELRDPRSLRLRRLRARCGAGRQQVNPAVGLLVGLAVTFTIGNQTHYSYGVAAGLLVGTAAVLDGGRGHPDTGRWGRSRWRALRSRVALTTGCLAGVPVGVAYGVTKSLTYGLVAGAVGTLAIALIVGAGRSAAHADTLTDPGTSWSQDLRHAAVFGLVTGLCLGAAYGFGNGRAAGWVAGLTTALGDGILIGLAGTAALSAHWRTTLLFLQLRRRDLFPALGMRFLKDAYERDLLRAEGPRYQFRHALLRDQLAGRRRNSG
ncbi:hypothetical protein [Streptomyces sp. NPDC003077]|uniref:NACHT domain-containing protein n=1 Tax=Streptomyces sp. NPDC003077 TaxID=3154443 RepID=UPI0033B2C42A